MKKSLEVISIKSHPEDWSISIVTIEEVIEDGWFWWRSTTRRRYHVAIHDPQLAAELSSALGGRLVGCVGFKGSVGICYYKFPTLERIRDEAVIIEINKLCRDYWDDIYDGHLREKLKGAQS